VKLTRCTVNIQILSYHLERRMFTLDINVTLCKYTVSSRQIQNAYCHSECSRMSAVLICHELQWTLITIHTSGPKIQVLLPICTGCIFFRINTNCFFPMQLLLNDHCNGDAAFSLMWELYS